MSEQKNEPQPQVEDVADDAMDEVSGGYPNFARTTQNGQGVGYGGLHR